MRKWTAGGMESMIMLFHMALNIVPPSQDTLEKIFHDDSFLSQGGMESMIMLFHMALNIVLPSQDTLEKIFHDDSFLSQGVSRQSRINVRDD